jgi:acyl-CoA synthetase (AMP-forming)/AMP-acid ligase II
VYGVPDAMGSTAIEAAVVFAHGSARSIADLLAHASRQLPRHALPEHFSVLEAMPLTGTAKVDRVTLRAQALARRAALSEITA